jgi:FixJ family two-component response regulator
MPIVFLTGHGDIPMSVRAMKAGAADFLTKPVSTDALLAAVSAALARGVETRHARAEIEGLAQRFATLTTREREVFAGVTAGKLNKQIASDLGIVEQTVKFHRARLMERMGARTVAELMHMAARLESASSAPRERP